MKRFTNIYLGADPGGAGGGDPAVRTNDPAVDELEKLRAENKALKSAEAERKAKEEEDRKAKLSADQKKAEEEKALRDSLVAANREIQLKRAGIGDEYASLVSGTTAEQIKASGDLLAKLVEETKAAAIASVKQTLSGSGEPGVGAGTDKAVTLEDFTKNILKGGK